MVGFITGSRRDTGTPEVIIEDSSGRVPIWANAGINKRLSDKFVK